MRQKILDKLKKSILERKGGETFTENVRRGEKKEKIKEDKLLFSERL